jgi:Zn-dependent protease with chaperone function
MNERIKVLMIVMLSLLAIPITGLIIANNISNKYESQFNEAMAKEYKVSESDVIKTGVTLHILCAENSGKTLDGICEYVDNIDYLKKGSLYTLILGISLLAFVYLMKLGIGLNRARLALLFSPIATITILVVSVSILLQSVILIYGFYITEVVYTEKYHPKIIFILALGALLAIYALTKALFSALKSAPMFVFSEKITSENGSKLIKLVDEIATKIGATPPKNIIVGLEPNFYVTAGKVAIADTAQLLEGTTMYLSLPFLSIFSKDELSAVIGHELGHFKGEDTAYSMRFYPAYKKLYNALNNLQQDDNESQSIFSVIALAPISLVLNEFSKTERTIGRARELEADKAGSSVVGNVPLISSLLKISEFAPIWSELRQYNIDKLNEGNIFNNLSNLYIDVSENRFENLDFEASSEHLLTTVQSHPTDTHPTISERMQSLNVEIKDINKELLKPSKTNIDVYLNNVDEINEKLTIQEHKLMIHYGVAKLPEQQEDETVD